MINWNQKSKTEKNPFLEANLVMRDDINSLISSKFTWQIIAVLLALLLTASIAGMIYISSQVKIIPYIVEVDSLGVARSQGTLNVNKNTTVDEKIIKSTLSNFISNFRTVSADGNIHAQHLQFLSATLQKETPAFKKIHEILLKRNPLETAKTALISVENLTVLRATPESWQIEWVETIRDRKGNIINKPKKYKALAQVKIIPHTEENKDILINPLGIYVQDINIIALGEKS